MNTLYEFDARVQNEGFAALCGVDEAGRGPLAGDVFAAAVVLNEGFFCAGINDSKAIKSETKRQKIAELIKQNSIWSVASATVDEIERYNILRAAMLAMERAVAGLRCVPPDMVLVDGNRLPGLPVPARAVVGGDAFSACVAAASILAKTARDETMRELAKTYPQYAFEKHKGYGTKLHYEMLQQHGISPIHRPSFLKSLMVKP